MTAFNKILTWFLSGVCHQIPERCFLFNGMALPLCARCTGTFSGAFVSLLILWIGKRRRASNLPPPHIIAMLIAFILLWALDGLNSVLSVIPDLPHLYEPHNLLRFATGYLEGLALSVLLLPVFNHIVWERPDEARAVERTSWFLLPLLIMALAMGFIQMGVESVILTMFISAVLGLLTLLTMVNGMLICIGLKWEGQSRRGRDLVLPLVLGMLAGVIEVSIMATGRAC